MLRYAASFALKLVFSVAKVKHFPSVDVLDEVVAGKWGELFAFALLANHQQACIQVSGIVHWTDAVGLGAQLGVENIQQEIKGLDSVRLLIEPEALLVVCRLEQLPTQLQHVD